MTLISVVVPAYQEESTIVASVRRISDTFQGLGEPFEIIVVSDGSTDATADVLKSANIPDVIVHHYERNRGKGAALRHGFSEARGDIVAMIDADLDLHPRCLLGLVSLLRLHDADAAIGSKIHPDSSVAYPAFRRLQSWSFRKFTRLLFRLDVSDTQTGAKVFTNRGLNRALPLTRDEGFTFDLELLVAINDLDMKIVEGPVELNYQFNSTLPLLAAARMAREAVTLAARRRKRARREGQRLGKRVR